MPRIQTLISDALDVFFAEQGEREKRLPFLINTHLQLHNSARQTIAKLDDVFEALQGDSGALAVNPVDYYSDRRALIIENNEHQHFTPMRQIALSYYTSISHIGFNLDEYKEICDIKAKPLCLEARLDTEGQQRNSASRMEEHLKEPILIH